MIEPVEREKPFMLKAAHDRDEVLHNRHSKGVRSARENTQRTPMTGSPNAFLLLGAALSAMAALLHVGCILFGAPWYRFFGAGERIARMAENGHWYPTLVTLFITTVLTFWSVYALSGAGVIRRLPLVRMALCVITAIYLLRAVAFFALRPYFPGNSAAFWWWSSAVCLVLGLVHLVGLQQVWARLGGGAD